MIGITGGILLLCILGIVVLNLVFYVRGIGMSEGRFLETNGGHMLVVDNSPIRMSNRSGNENLSSGLTNGDKVLVIHDGIAESYPAQTGAYYCLKLKDVEEICNRIILINNGKIVLDGAVEEIKQEFH